MIGISEMCPEVIYSILNFLDPIDLLHASMTCKRLRSAAQIPSLWKKMSSHETFDDFFCLLKHTKSCNAVWMTIDLDIPDVKHLFVEQHEDIPNYNYISTLMNEIPILSFSYNLRKLRINVLDGQQFQIYIALPDNVEHLSLPSGNIFLSITTNKKLKTISIGSIGKKVKLYEHIYPPIKNKKTLPALTLKMSKFTYSYIATFVQKHIAQNISSLELICDACHFHNLRRYMIRFMTVINHLEYKKIVIGLVTNSGNIQKYQLFH